MPNSPLVECNYPGCSTLVVKGRCSRHAMIQERRSGYAEANRFYHSALWLRVRKQKLARDPLCQYCAFENKFVEATVVDHDKPLADGGHRTDPENLVSCCAAHHNRKTAQERLGLPFDKRVPNKPQEFGFA